MLAEIAVAFILVFSASSLVYLLGGKSAKSKLSENGQSTYACGERAVLRRLTINVSLYKYLVYFVIMDSSVLLVAFASPGLYAGNAMVLALYLLIVAGSGLVLVRGRDH